MRALTQKIPGVTGVMLVVCLLLSSCGFHLRGTGEHTAQIPELYLHLDNNFGELSQSVRRILIGNGTEIVADAQDAPWSLYLSTQRNQRRIASTNSQIVVAKYTLQMQIDFRLEARDGSALIPLTTLNTERLYEFDSSNLTGSNNEEQILKEEMRSELINQMLRRIEMTIGSQPVL